MHCQAKGIVRQWVHADHIVALGNGGPDTEANLQGLCSDCHKAKTRADMGHAEPATFDVAGNVEW